jgi:hypothetical protein
LLRHRHFAAEKVDAFYGHPERLSDPQADSGAKDDDGSVLLADPVGYCGDEIPATVCFGMARRTSDMVAPET